MASPFASTSVVEKAVERLEVERVVAAMAAASGVVQVRVVAKMVVVATVVEEMWVEATVAVVKAT